MKFMAIITIVLLGVICFAIPTFATPNYILSADVLSISNDGIDVQFQWLNNTNNMGLCFGYFDNSTDEFSISAFYIGTRAYMNDPVDSLYYGTGVGYGTAETQYQSSDGSLCLVLYAGYQKIIGEKLSFDGGLSMINMYDVDVFLGYYVRVGLAF